MFELALDTPGRFADRPSSMRDLYPQQAKLRRMIENKLLRFFEQHGYEMVSSGSFEFVDTLLRGRVAAEAEQWVQLFDPSGRAVALRPDMTPSIARMAAPLLAGGRSRVQWCYAERVYRRSNDPASLSWVSGKAAESTQVGIEWIGDGEMVDSDCDVIALCEAAIAALKVPDWQLVVSHAGVAPAMLGALGASEVAVSRLLNLLAAGDYVGFRHAFAEVDGNTDALGLLGSANPYRPDSFLRLDADWDSTAGRQALAAWDYLVQLAGTLERRGLRDRITFDLTLCRNLTYYTGIVFEAFAPGVGAPIAGGGRYDDLLAQFGQADLALGFTFEVERVMAALTRDGWAPLQEHPEDGGDGTW